MLKATYRVSIVLAFFFVGGFCCTEAQITPGVQQPAAQTATITGTVERSDGTPVAGAEVRLTGSAVLTTKSDAHGMFEFTGVPYGTYAISAISPALGTAVHEGVIVRGDIAMTIQYTAKDTSGGLKTIARVSTNSAGLQINVSPASIASIAPSQYAFEGNTSWKELLDQIPGVSVSGNLAGGTSFDDFIPDSPLQPIVLSINGTLPCETSTTLDGMPLLNVAYSGPGPGTGTDVGFLPMAMFETADVVRGPGANAPSIVDSIGGSFVLHAPRPVDKNQVEFSISNDPYGGIVSNAKAAFRIGKFSAIIAYGTNNSPGPFGNGNTIPAYAPTPLTVNGQAFSSGGFLGYIPNATYPNCFCGYQTSLLVGNVPVNSEWTQHNGAIALSYSPSPSVTAQVFYAGAASRVQQPGPNIPVEFTPDPSYTGVMSPGLYSFLSLNCLVGTTQTNATSLLEEKVTGYIGAGVLRLAALQDNSFTQYGVPSVSLPNGSYTLYGTGYYAAAPTTPVNFNGTPADLTFFQGTVNSTNWVNNHDFLIDYATALGAETHVGISFVTSSYDTPFQYSFAYGPPFNFGGSIETPTADTEKTDELRLYGGMQVSNRLLLNASWYFVRGTYHIQDPSDQTRSTYIDSTMRYSAPRLGVVWRPNRDQAVRLAIGGGYTLPALGNRLGTDFPASCSTVCNQTLTNLNLKPEESFGFDVGTDIRLRQNTVISADVYRTNLYGQFYSSTNLTGTYLGLPLYTTEIDNLARSRYEGIILDVRRDAPTGVFWHGALGLTRGYVVSLPSGFYDQPGNPNSINTYIIPGINFDGKYQSTVPYANGTLQVGYRWTPAKYADLTSTYFGDNNQYFEPAFFEFDAHAGYPLTRNISLLAIFRNITGIYDGHELYQPTLGAPSVAGFLYPLFGIPYGPRSIIVTFNFES